MALALSIHKRWHKVPIAAAPQILTCAYCVLEKWEHDNLAAPYWRWYWNEDPGAFLIMNNKHIPVAPGRVMLIPPQTDCGTGCEGLVGHLFMHFTLGLDRTVTPGRIFTHKPAPAERVLIRRLIRALKRSGSGSSLEVSFLAQAVVNPALAAVPADYWAGSLPDRRMAKALQHLREGGAGVNNAGLAREAGMNVNAFIRKFRQATGHTPHQYRLRLRIEQTCGWLRAGTMTMEEIAEAAEFCDRFHFSRVFKQVMGMSPAKFRHHREGVA